MAHDKIAVIDFGGQYAHLIANKIRRLHVLGEIIDPQAPIDQFRGYKGIILSGSPDISSADEGSDFTKEIFDLDVPILGFCYGHQEVAKRYGGVVEHTQREYGTAKLHITRPSRILSGLGPVESVWMSHGDTVTRAPADFEVLAYSDVGGERTENAAIACDARKRYGFQFHPEVEHTRNGERMLANFVLDVCGCKQDWTMARFIDEAEAGIREVVGDRQVLLLASGGIDSTVAAKLLAAAIGTERLHLLHVDTGLMRQGESQGVVAELRALGLAPSLHFVDASSEFLDRLAGVVEPEKKRRIIGDTFIDIVEREASKLDLTNFVLGQGTIYPDRIETKGSKRADLIKTHHNRVPIIEQMIRDGRVVEPLQDLYKTEVRELARELGLAASAVLRHPFPGPGLGIRVLCADGPEPSRDDAEAATAIAAVLAGSGLAGTRLPIRSVGVKGDLRSYERPVMLRAASGTAPVLDHDHDDLLHLAARLYRTVPGINRVLLALAPATWETATVVPATITRERLSLLRELDAFVMGALERHGIAKDVWQCPTVIVPIALDGKGQELLILRPVETERGMTASPARLPAALCSEVVAEARRHPAISGVAIDLTTKPPGTIEWE